MFNIFKRKKSPREKNKEVKKTTKALTLVKTEPLMDNTRERTDFILNWIRKEFDDSSPFSIEKKDYDSYKVVDLNKDYVAIFSWKTDPKAPEIIKYTTPWIVSQNNVRIRASCAFGYESMPCDGSMIGRLRRARSAFGGQMSTN